MYKFIGGISKSCIAFLENMKFNHVILYNYGACRRKRSGKFWNLTYKIGWMSKKLIFVFGFFADHSELVLVHWTIDVISVCWFPYRSSTKTQLYKHILHFIWLKLIHELTSSLFRPQKKSWSIRRKTSERCHLTDGIILIKNVNISSLSKRFYFMRGFQYF